MSRLPLPADMDPTRFREILDQVRAHRITVEEAERSLAYLPYEDLGFAKVDHHRELRSGLAESVYGPGKTPEQVAAIVVALMDRSEASVLVTRANAEQYRATAAAFPEAQYDEMSGLIVVRPSSSAPTGVVTVASAGTADQPVAREAELTAAALGMKVETLRDVGVAGIHRLLGSVELLQSSDVVIVVAGMEGALASMVGGLVGCPVIAVPTSVGYGAGAGGIAPLLTMLNSCAPGVAVVNIDNGYGAAVFAATILRKR